MTQHKLGQLLAFFSLLIVAALCLGQFGVIYQLNQGSIYLFDLLIPIFNLFGLLYLIKTKQTKIPLPLFSLLTAAALGGISLCFTPLNLSVVEHLIAAGYWFRFVSYILFALIIKGLINTKAISIDRLLKTLIYSGLVLFGAGVLQLLLFPDLGTLDLALGWDPHKNRMVSTFFDPNFLGAYFVITLSAALKLKSQKKVIYIAFFLLGILLTFSRSAWLAAALLIFFSGLKRKALLGLAVTIALLALFTVPRIQTRLSGVTDPQDSASFRLVSWQNTWVMIKENWVFGVGYNAFRYAQYNYGFLDDITLASRSGAGSDASLLLVWATSGIFALFFYLGAFLVLLFRAIKMHDMITAGLILAILGNSLFINSLFYPQILLSLTTVWWPLRDSNL
ncbi:O-antigen ligase family protein [Patescibacteria group bacterium]|nr:O-antigen ligase family protein [Patescibacteria group bacterium]